MIVLTADNGKEFYLNDHLIWRDEGEYSDLAQAQSYTLTGSLYVESSLKKAGRTITLSAEPNQGLKTREHWEELQLFYEKTRTSRMMLTRYDGLQRPVIWRATDGPPIETKALIGYADPRKCDYLGMTIRLTQLNR